MKTSFVWTQTNTSSFGSRFSGGFSGVNGFLLSNGIDDLPGDRSCFRHTAQKVHQTAIWRDFHHTTSIYNDSLGVPWILDLVDSIFKHQEDGLKSNKVLIACSSYYCARLWLTMPREFKRLPSKLPVNIFQSQVFEQEYLCKYSTKSTQIWW